MLHRLPKSYLRSLLLALAAAGAALPSGAQAGCMHAVDPALEQTLFTFDALLIAASSVATPGQKALLHPFALDYRSDAALERAFPVRAQVAQAVTLWPLELRQRMLAFVVAHLAAVTNYNALVVQLVGAPPTFTPFNQPVAGGPSEQAIYADRAQLATLLRDAYVQGNLASLWSTIERGWEQGQLCSDQLAQLRAKIAAYTRLTAEPLTADSKVVQNPLMPPGSGVTCIYGDGHFVMLIGPTHSRREQDMLVTHELLHPILNALFKRERRFGLTLAKTACVFAQVTAQNPSSTLTRYVYDTWESYLSETLVRSISHRLTGVGESRRTSFLVAPRIGESLARFEAEPNAAFIDATLEAMEALRRQWCPGSVLLAHAPAAAAAPVGRAGHPTYLAHQGNERSS